MRVGRFKKFNVFKRFNACLSAGVDEFGRFGVFGAGPRPCQRVGTFECLRFGRYGRFKKFNVFKRFNACLSAGFDKLNYTIEIIRRVGVGI